MGTLGGHGTAWHKGNQESGSFGVTSGHLTGWPLGKCFADSPLTGCPGSGVLKFTVRVQAGKGKSACGAPHLAASRKPCSRVQVGSL